MTCEIESGAENTTADTTDAEAYSTGDRVIMSSVNHHVRSRSHKLSCNQQNVYKTCDILRVQALYYIQLVVRNYMYLVVKGPTMAK